MLRVTAVWLIVATIVWSRISPAHRLAPTVSDPNRRTRLWGLIGMMCLAAVMRSTRITESLWYDEIASWMTYAGGAKSIGAVIGNFFDPINQPFHTLLNYISVPLLTKELGLEIAFRMPAFVFSLLTVPVMFCLARSMGRGNSTAVFAAGLSAIVPVAVLEGTEARGYSMMIFFSAVVTWLLIKARRRQQPWLWALYAVACALGTWSHFVTAFVPIGHGVWLMWRAIRFREWQHCIHGGIALILGAVITITLYSPIIPGMLAARGMFAVSSDSQPTILGIEGLHALLQLGGSWYWWAAIPGLVLLLIGLTISFRPQNLETRTAVELATTGLPLMVIAVALSGTWVYARFSLFALPGVILLIAIAIDWLWKRRIALGLMAAGIVAIGSIADLALRPAKQPLRNAADYVHDHGSPNDRLLAIGLAHPVLRLYTGDPKLTYVFKHGENLPRALATVQPQWLIVDYPNSVKPETYRFIEQSGFKEAVRFPGWADWTNGDVIVYHK